MAKQWGNGQWQCVCGFNNRPTNEVCGGNGPMGCKQPREGGDEAAEEPPRRGPGYGPVKGAGKMMARASTPYLPAGYAPAGSTSGGLAGGTWTCVCGFSNKPHNEVCGGNGPMGCKMPKPQGGKGRGGGRPAYAPAYPAAFPVAYAPMAAYGGMKGGSSEKWECTACGFSNKAQNEVCGGNGPLGCKAPFQPPKPQRPQFNPRVQHAAPQRQRNEDQWMCACGFKNRSSNAVCGGAGGTMGCKAPREESEGPVRSPRGGQRNSSQDEAPKWTCACGFVNKATNEVCGGRGPMGCKEPKPEEEEDEDAETLVAD